LAVEDKPSFLLRLEGKPMITGTKYALEITRCNLCRTRFYTKAPASIAQAPKYDASCTSTLAIARYSMGVPMSRLEGHQAMHGIPLPDATQWDLLKKGAGYIQPVLTALINEAGNGELMHYDGTPNRILEQQTQGKASQTTALISVVNGKKVHLFFTGTSTPATHVDSILNNRTSETPLISMMDASSSNFPKTLKSSLIARFILCFCLVHGRRKFYELFPFFEKQCGFVLSIFSAVYANEAYCRDSGLSPDERLVYHQTHSEPLMAGLYHWLNKQLLYEQTEMHSGYGKAIKYLLRHWSPLTAFLRIAGAPLDNNWAERMIRIVIRHRRNSLYYRNQNGAAIGDCYMSLIYTAKENEVNPMEYLNALQKNAAAVAEHPELWLPWNYHIALNTQTTLAA